MSYVTLLYLFYLTSASSDVDSPSESPTIWQCYAENSICGSYIKDSPSLRNNCALTAEDLPSERPVLIDSLVSKILSSQANVSYGLLIFEAGNDAYVKWQLSTPSSLSVDLAYESVPPLVQESFVRDLAIYHFSAAAYNGAPAEVLLVAPGASLSVSRKKTGEESSTASSCRHAALVAAPVKWTAAVAAEFAQRVNRIVVSVCKLCTQLPLSSDFIRICPPQQQHDPADRTPTDIVITDFRPTVWDISAPSQVFEVAIDAPDVSTINNVNCSLASETGVILPLNVVELSSPNNLKLVLKQRSEADTYFLECWFIRRGQKTFEKATYDNEAIAANYTSLIEIGHGTVAIPCRAKAITAEANFKHPLPQRFVEGTDEHSFCYIENLTYPGSFTNLTMTCFLDNITLSHDADAYFVRSPALLDITLQKQVPIRLQIACVSTTALSPVSNASFLEATLTRDLLGIVIKSESFKTFPVGLVSCNQLVADDISLGDGAVCIGDGNNVAVQFGDEPSVGVGNSIDVLGQKIEVKKHDGMASRESAGPLPLMVYVSLQEKNHGHQVHPNFTIFAPSKVMMCMQTVIVEVKQITGNGRRALSYQWQMKNVTSQMSALLAKESGRTLSFLSKLLTSEAAVAVTACNFVNECTTSEDVLLQPVTAAATLSLSLGGSLGLRTLTPSMAVRLRALPELTRCNSSLTVVPNDAQYNWFLDHVFVTNDDSYRIPAFTYEAGDSVEVRVEVNYKDPSSSQHLSATTEETLVYVAEKLVTTVDAISRSIASDAAVVLDASQSKNPNVKDGSVTHEWTCFNETSQNKCELPTGLEKRAAYLRIPPRILNLGMSFNFTDTVRAQNLSDATWSMVTVGQPRLPQIKFSPIATDRFSPNDYVRIRAYVTVQQGWLNTTWEVIRTPDTSKKTFTNRSKTKVSLLSCFFELSSFLPNPNSTFTQTQLSQSNQVVVSLTIPPANPMLYPTWTGLLAGMQYNIRLTAYSRDGSSFADVRINVDAPPSVGTVEVVPAKGAIALTTQIEFRVGDGWMDEDQPLEYRFGLKILFIDNSTQSYWFPRAGATSYRLYLPSAQLDNPSCGSRTGFKAILEVCDHYLSCSVAESAVFEVQPPANLSVAVVDMVAAINSDIGNGNVFSALSNMYALDVQKCEEDLDVVTADKITSKLLLTLDESSDSSDYKEVLASASRLMNVVTTPVLQGLTLVLEHYRKLIGLSSVPSTTRSKRAVTTNTGVDEQEASDMLNMYDLLLEKNQPIVEVYLLNIRDFLSTFCIQLDSSSSRIMTAQGSGHTIIQAQSLVPGSANFSSSLYTIAGDSEKVIGFSTEFRARFTSWHCGPSLVVCQNICLASSQIKMLAVLKNDQLMERLFGNSYEAISVNKSVSQLYQIYFMDPLSGDSVGLPPNIIQYSVHIPLTTYQPSNYYACLMFDGRLWQETKCLASSFAKQINNANYIRCDCSTSGMLSVFTTAAPVPMNIPDHSEIRLTFQLSSGAVPTSSQQEHFVSRLASSSHVDQRRFVNAASAAATANSSEISLILRPPFLLSQMTNGYAVQAIQRAVHIDSGFKAYDSVAVVKSAYTVINRTLNGDGNARKVIMTIDRSFQTVVGNDTAVMASKWTESMANMLRISIYRFKNARIYMGIVFNFTITLPFEDEKTPLSAEEISLMLMECSNYGELDLQSNQGETLPVGTITSSNIVELIVNRQWNTLVLVLVIVISTVLAFASLYVSGAIAVKIRTDRLIEEERQRIVQIEHSQPSVPPPQYTQTAAPAPSLGERYPDHRLRNVARAHHA